MSEFKQTHTSPLAGNIQPEPKWMRVREAATYARLSRSTLYTLMNEGRVRYKEVRVTPCSLRTIRLISVSEMDYFLENLETKGGQA